jgi:tRNA modification GTPase
MPDGTICAVATPPGRGGIGVIRVSGAAAGDCLTGLAGRLPEPRTASLRTFRDADGNPLDQGLVLWFPGPDSFTGEDVAEFHGHGGPVVMDRLLRRLIELGASLAEPGEFSQRAFLNGRMDLTRAEAIADLIAAGSEAAASAAMRSLEGAFAHRIQDLLEQLTELRVHLESSIDFIDEPLDGLAIDRLADRIEAVGEAVRAAREAARSGQQLQEGARVVIAGAPNAGKSSLMNALLGRDAAIVTELAGTTRDVLDAHLHLDGLPVQVMDTAGLRTGADVVEAEGIRRAHQAMTEADHILLVVDDRNPGDDDGLGAAWPSAAAALTRVYNKIDLTDRPPGVGEDGVAVSALTGAGLDGLKSHLRGVLGVRAGDEAVFTARRRHLQALDEAAAAIDEAVSAARAGHGEELVAESLRCAQDSLGQITGAVTTEDLLGRIFSTFCIGK